MSRISPARIRVERATSSTLSPRASRAADSVAPIARSARRSGWVTVHLLRRPWYGGIVGYQAFPRWVGRLHPSLGGSAPRAVSYTHLRAHETRHDLVCRLLLEKKK